MKFYLVNEKYLDFLRTSESKIMNVATVKGER